MRRTSNRRQFVSRVVRRLGNTYRPKRMILFGSYAYGRPTSDSDLDLLIVKETKKSFHQRLFEVRQLASPVLQGHPFDPIVLTSRELQRRMAVGDQFLRDIITKGKSVYGGT